MEEEHGLGDGGGDSVSGVLLAMPALTKRTNMSVLGERLQPMTVLVTVSHGLVTVLHLAHLALRSQGDRVFNDAGTYLAAEVTWSYLLTAVLRRRTLRRLHAELVDYCRDVETHTPALERAALAPLPATLRRLWAVQTAFTLSTWAFYTASPFVFEYIHDIPLGSLRRLSGMVFPVPCDLRGEVCYVLTYFAVAFEWFLAALAFSSVECTNLVYYTVVTRQFGVLSASLSRVIGCEAQDGQGQHTHVAALRRCVSQHQFLLRWSKDMVGMYAVPLFARLGAMVLLIALPLLKLLLVKNYVLDELPLVGLYGAQTIFVLCYIADELSRASGEVHGMAYMSAWYHGRPGFRRCLQIVLTRTLHPVETRAVWVHNLSLRTFLEVLNKSYTALQTIRAARKGKRSDEG
nr:odorant receptor [Odontothrips loti]